MTQSKLALLVQAMPLKEIIMSTIGDLSTNVKVNLMQTGDREETAGVVGNRLLDLENDLIDLYSLPDDKKLSDVAPSGMSDSLKSMVDQYKSKDMTVAGLRDVVQVKFQRALRVYDAFQNILRSAHETAMKAIQNLRLQ